MGTVTFDTLKFADTLKAAGVLPAHAEAEARAISAAIGEVDVATKRDIEDLRREIQSMELRLTIKIGAFMAVFAGVIIGALKAF